MGYFKSLLILIKILSVFWFKIVNVEGIIGGNDASLGKFTHTVSVQLNDVHICGGAIISGLNVLTAAQCVINENDEFKKGIFSIIAGVVSLVGEEFERIKTRVIVNKIYVLKEFKHVKINDIYSKHIDNGNLAVLKLKEYLDLEKGYLKALNFPKRTRTKATYNGMKARVFGFGVDSIDKLQNDFRKSVECTQCNKLKYAETTIIDKKTCKKTVIEVVKQHHLCAQVVQSRPQDPEGVCEGDVGSPLIMNDDTLVGILIRAEKSCSEKNKPAIYTKVAVFVNFIYHVMLVDDKHDNNSSYNNEYRLAYNSKRPDGIEELQEFYNFL